MNEAVRNIAVILGSTCNSKERNSLNSLCKDRSDKKGGIIDGPQDATCQYEVCKEMYFPTAVSKWL